MLEIFKLIGDMFWSVWDGLDMTSPFYAPLYMTLFIWFAHQFRKVISVGSYR